MPARRVARIRAACTLASRPPRSYIARVSPISSRIVYIVRTCSYLDATSYTYSTTYLVSSSIVITLLSSLEHRYTVGQGIVSSCNTSLSTRSSPKEEILFLAHLRPPAQHASSPPCPPVTLSSFPLPFFLLIPFPFRNSAS